MSSSDWNSDDSSSSVNVLGAYVNSVLVESVSRGANLRATRKRLSLRCAVRLAHAPSLTLHDKLRLAFCRNSFVLGPRLKGLVDNIVRQIQHIEVDRAETAMLIGKALSDPLNHSLRENLWTGKLSEEELVKMNEFELLNPVDRSALEEERKARLEQKTVAFIEELASVKTELYPCPQCGNKECYANFRSTDFVKWHGDDPTPTILKCKKCGHHFRM